MIRQNHPHDSRKTLYNELVQKDGIVALPVSDPYFQEIQENVWMQRVGAPGARVAVKDAIEILKTNEQDADLLIQHMKDFRAIYPQMAALLDGQPSLTNAKAFFNLWIPLDDYIYGAIEGEMKRGTFSAPALGDYSGQEQMLLLDIVRDKNGNYVAVYERGGLYSSTFAIEQPALDKDQLLEIAKSLEYFDRVNLRKYMDIVKKDADKYSNIVHISEETPVYLEGYFRWVVNVLISNSGQNPMSFSPEAVLYVNSEDAQGFAENVAVDLEVRNQKGELEPITVSGGDTKLVTLVSHDLVSAYPKWRDLESLFRSSSRNCFIAMQPEGNPWLINTAAFSQIRAFGIPTSAHTLSPTDVRTRFQRRSDGSLSQ
jgi:hypothetical protein